MQTLKLYLYPNTVEIQIWDTSIFSVRNRIVYSRPVKIYQGVDNPIQVIIKNQDQKPVNLTGSKVTASIQDPVNHVTVKSYVVTWANIQIGQGTFTFDAGTINSLEQRFYKLAFSVTAISSDVTSPVYIDDNYGVPLDLQILPVYYSAIQPYTDTYTMDGGSL